MGVAEAIVKLGGSVITFKDKPMEVNRRVLKRLAHELSASGLKRLVIVHGGGSFGHPLALKYGLTEGFKGLEEQVKGFIATHRTMLKLNEVVLEALEAEGFKPVSIPPLVSTVASSGFLKKILYEPIVKALDIGLIPVTFGDVVFDCKRGFTVVSGDTLMAELASKLKPLKTVFTVDVDGLYTENPKLNADAALITEATVDDVKKLLSRLVSKASDATGGIRLKLEEACRIAYMGIDVYIVNGLKPSRLLKALKGVKVRGTVVKGVRL